MSPSGGTTVILPFKLGPASKFEKSNFPLASFKGINGIVSDGSVLLSATVDEMDKIIELGLDLSSNPLFLQNTGFKYADLASKQEELEKIPKSLNPIKYFRNYRAARMFYAAALSLYKQTRETSESMAREKEQKEVRVDVVPTTELQPVDRDGSSPPDAPIEALAIHVSGTWTAREQQRIVNAANMIHKHATDPFVDNPAVPQLCDGDSIYSLPDTASVLTQNTFLTESGEAEPLLPPNSPSYHFYFINSAVAASSNVRDIKIDNGSKSVGTD